MSFREILTIIEGWPLNNRTVSSWFVWNFLGASAPQLSLTIAQIMRRTHSPPIQAWTPYQIQAIAARLNTGQRAPQIPKLARLTTGKEMWYVAPILPVRQTKEAAMVYPSQTQIHDSHQERPTAGTIMEDEIIHVF